jgi:hypothetical protein
MTCTGYTLKTSTRCTNDADTDPAKREIQHAVDHEAAQDVAEDLEAGGDQDAERVEPHQPTAALAEDVERVEPHR